MNPQEQVLCPVRTEHVSRAVCSTMNILAQGEARLRLSACDTQNSGLSPSHPFNLAVQTALKQSRARQQHPRAQESFCAPETILEH